jgi:hypothetical protein
VANFARPFIFEVEHKHTGGNYMMIGAKDTGAGISYTDFVYAGYPVYDGGGNRLQVYEDGAYRGDSLKAISSGVWQYYKLEVYTTGAKYYHGSTPDSYTVYYTSSYSTETPLKVGFPNYNQAFRWDNARVRKYTSTEPTYSIGGEEVSVAYLLSGNLTSMKYDAGSAINLDKIYWTASTPSGTTVKFQIRSATTEAGLDSATWYGPTGTGDYYTTSGNTINTIHNGNRWIQYKTYLETTDTKQTPILSEIRITYIKQ